MLTAKKALAAARVYTQETAQEMGALKGAPCTIKSIVKSGNLNTVTFEWTDRSEVTHESTMLVLDGADGFSPTITVKTATSSEYVLTITDKNGSYDTPNLKGGGGGGGGASSLSDLDDIALASLANGDVLVYDSTAGKWKNVQLDIPTQLSDLSDIDLASLADADILKYDFANQKWVNGKLDYSELTGTPALGTAAAKDSTNAITENSTDLIESGAVYTGLAAKADTADLGTAAAKDSTNAVTQSSTDLIESGAVYTALADKVDKEAGKGLSTNDFTDTEKSKLDNMELDDLADVDMTGITDGQVLAWDDTTSKMVPANQTGTTYTAGAGIDISQQNEISSEVVQFSGTLAEWNELTTAEKIQYTDAVITNDTESGIVDLAPTQNSNHLVTSGGVYTVLSAKANTADLGTAAAKDATNAVTQSSTDLVESGAVYTAIGSAIADLDVSDSAVAGSYVTAVSETDGAISVTREAADATPISASNKMIKSGGVYSAVDDVYKANGVLGAKNLITYPHSEGTTSKHGLDFTDNGDGSVTIDGTNTASSAVFYNLVGTMSASDVPLKAGTYILSNDVNLPTGVTLRFGNTNGQYFDVTEKEITGTFNTNISLYCLIRIAEGASVDNVTLYPMLRLASDTDSTYQPYAKTNQELTRDSVTWKDNAKLGAKNLIPFPYANVSGIESYGITYTYGKDGVITLSNDTSTGSSTFLIFEKIKGSDLQHLNGCILNGITDGDNYVYIAIYKNTSPYTAYAKCTSGDTIISGIPNDSTLVNCCIRVSSGQTGGNRTIKPMIRLADDNDDAYAPYAMTNRQLSTSESGTITYSIQATETGMTTIKKVGKVVQCNMMAKIGEAVSAWTTFATIPEGFRPATFIQVVNNKTMYTGFNIIQISPQGTVQSATALAADDKLRFTAVWILP